MPSTIESVKKQILVVEDNADIKDLIVMHVESEFNVTILYAEDVVKAIEEIKKNSPSVVICKYNLPERKGSDLYNYIKIRELNFPLILITEKYVAEDEKLRGFLTSNQHNTYFRLPIKEADFVKKIGNIINLVQPSVTENYRRIRGKSARMFHAEGTPVYLMDNENKYIPVSDFSSLDANPESFAYVKLDDYKKMSIKINANIIKKLQHPGLDFKEKFSLQFESVKKIHASLRDLGLSEEEIKLGRAVYASSLNVINEHPRMSTLLGGMVKYDQYVYRLSMMCNYLSIAMVTKTTWYSSHSIKKLSMASIFQDIGLQDNELAQIVSTGSEDYIRLLAQSRKKVLEHPMQSVKLLKEIKDVDDISSNVENIIMFHHVRPDGTGYPEMGDMGALSELARIFIIAHEFSHRLLSQKLPMEVLEEILVDFEASFSKGKFRAAYAVFMDVFRRKNALLSRAKAS